MEEGEVVHVCARPGQSTQSQSTIIDVMSVVFLLMIVICDMVKWSLKGGLFVCTHI